ncbi:MAG: DUF1848 domain-containing protein [Clostridiales bacterium]|nr:DUF1848 domain-containing protein [Clostridiales bacterium]
MIISASRRTDIPCRYSEWFFNRIKDGYALVANPMNANQISRIDLSPSVVDCIVFWTKNPTNMLDSLDKLDKYAYYFQFTLTGYGTDVEARIPNKSTEIIPAFKNLSKAIGREKVIWRYDPIIITGKYTTDFHINAFQKLAGELALYTEKVVISFVDLYAKTVRNVAGTGMRTPTQGERMELAFKLSDVARSNGLIIETCSETIDLGGVGIAHGCCIDKKLIERIIGCKLMVPKDNNQRKECGCVESIDIGAYNTCPNGCKYCYANYSKSTVDRSGVMYDPLSPILCRTIRDEDIVTERPTRSLKNNQISFWD